MKKNTKVAQDLNDGWELRSDNENDWIVSKVPGNVHLDLMRNQRIPDPFFGENESDLQWIADKDWTYKVTFVPDKEILDKRNIELFFHGLDTYADVYLNDTKVISANNMFHPWSVDVKKIIENGTNELVLHFRSPLKEVSSLMSALEHSLPADNDQAGKTSPFTRKAPYHYGWDWGPCFVTSGIWKDVELIGWDDWFVDDVHIMNTKVSNEIAELSIELMINSATDNDVSVTVEESRTGLKIEHGFTIVPGSNDLAFTMSIDDPDLWWPIGHGDQPLHDFLITVQTKDELQRFKRKIGIRDINIKREQDQKGESFEVHVNGMPIYSKGANWIPADSFVERLTRSDYERLLKDATRANMNTLRIWGGGIYEPDHFYELCDEMGIMVWQDFMFACSMYPAHDSFLRSVEKEARHQVDRLKHHPCIILWCGNNEVASGWLSWGWKEELPGSVWEDYRKLFHELLPSVCSELDPGRLYWPSSPGHSLTQSKDDQIHGKGDNHYWGVWHGGDDFEAFEDNVGRFMSEYGMQSFPDMRTIEAFTNEKDRSVDSETMNAHQKASLGTGNLIKYIEDGYRMNNSFESVVQLSQIMQAQAIRSAVESHRRNMPFCMGTLYWQFNDCWPVISWSSIDHGGNWKALHYLARHFFGPVLVSMLDRKGQVEIHVINDQHHGHDAELVLKLFKFDGTILLEEASDMEVDPFSSLMVKGLDKNRLISEHDPSDLILRAELRSNGRLLSKNQLFFKKPKDLNIPRPDYHHDVEKLNGRFQITIRSNSFLCQLHLRSRKVQGVFSDNYFDMLPGEVALVEFDPGEDCDVNELDLKINTLYEIMN